MKVRAGVIGLLLCVPGAFATLFTETSDAGLTVGTAQVVPWGTTDIYGYLDSHDVDLYQLTFGAAGVFEFYLGDSPFDDNLVLFDGAGHGIEGDDDGGGWWGDPLDAYIGVSLNAGTYLIAVGANNIWAFDSGNGALIGNDSGYVGLTPNVLDYWYADGSGTGNYRLRISPATSSPEGSEIPEPSTWILVGTGLVSAAGIRRLRHRAR